MVNHAWLLIFSDGSDLAYDFAAYISDGNLTMVTTRVDLLWKSAVLPQRTNNLSTPQMELNAAVLSKRGRKVIEKEMRFNFERVFYIVDSETVLNMINMQDLHSF